MTALRAAILAALCLLVIPTTVAAQDVTLRSHDGNVEISGNLLGFDGEFYRVDTVYGELTVDGSGVACEGPGCPNLEAYVARLVFSGAPTIGRVLMPALLEAFAIRGDYDLRRLTDTPTELRFDLHTGQDGTLIGQFTFRLTNTDEGFADLLANEADIAMTLREIRQDELQHAREAGLGNLTAPARMTGARAGCAGSGRGTQQPHAGHQPAQLSRALAGKIS